MEAKKKSQDSSLAGPSGDGANSPHSLTPDLVVVHPLVLLSVVDHYHRVAHDTSKRVVGILLGETFKGRVDVSNSFAVPFEEDAKDESVWFVDHDFVENMNRMFAKVNVKERIVGFYSTGPKLRANDLAIDADFRTRYCRTSLTPPIMCIVDVRPDMQGVPTQAYYSVEQVADEDKATKRTFRHVESQVGAYEAEEVGVEHLLRDINDPTVSTLASRVRHKMDGLRGLRTHLRELHTYLANVAEGRLPVNRLIVANLQEIVNLLPNYNVPELVSAFLVKTNDMQLIVYVASLVRAIVALHSLLTNKLNVPGEGSTATVAADGAAKSSKQQQQSNTSSSSTGGGNGEDKSNSKPPSSS